MWLSMEESYQIQLQAQTNTCHTLLASVATQVPEIRLSDLLNDGLGGNPGVTSMHFDFKVLLNDGRSLCREGLPSGSPPDSLIQHLQTN